MYIRGLNRTYIIIYRSLSNLPGIEIGAINFGQIARVMEGGLASSCSVLYPPVCTQMSDVSRGRADMLGCIGREKETETERSTTYQNHNFLVRRFVTD